MDAAPGACYPCSSMAKASNRNTGRTEEGPSPASLTCRVVEAKAKAAGIGVDLEELAKFISNPRATKRLSMEDRGVAYPTSAYSEHGETRITLRAGPDWKITVSYRGAPEGGGGFGARVIAMRRMADWGDRFVAHDTPDGSAAVTEITEVEDEKGGCRVYVSRQSHHSFGRKWNPTVRTPADTTYHPDGKPWMVRHYRNGFVAQPDESSPCAQSWWPDGSPQMVEYGDERRGRHRKAGQGPAFAEFFPNGVAALEVYAELDENDIARVSRWTCRTVDGDKRPDHEMDRWLIGAKLEAAKADASPYAGFVSRHGLDSHWACGHDRGGPTARAKALAAWRRLGKTTGATGVGRHGNMGGRSVLD